MTTIQRPVGKTNRNFSGLSTMLLILLLCTGLSTQAQGTWTALSDTAPDLSGGLMLLMTDGSVIVKTISDPYFDPYGNSWNKLTPDSTGSYIHGTWSVISPMTDSRYYFSSQVLRSGKVYVAGGEYGTGFNTAELYDPVTDTWSYIPGIDLADTLADANSKILPDGRVLQNIVNSNAQVYGSKNLLYDPGTNTYSPAPSCHGNADESAWGILPDNSILFVDIHSLNTERYIPSLNRWIGDAPTPVLLYDNYIYEDGPTIALPDGTMLFIGANNKTAIYYPSGDTTPGQWQVGPLIPNGNGIPDGSAAMMNNGTVLCAVSPMPNASNADSFFHSPTFFYEYDYVQQAFTQVAAPYGAPIVTNLNGPPYANIATYTTNMLDLPDGNVLFTTQYDNQFYVYTPGGTPYYQGKPAITGIADSGCQYMITGTLFNGISEGASYGDDWQMSTNYPIVSLKTSSGRVYYARTHDWNRTGIQTGALPDTAYFSIPENMPNGRYLLSLSANGISSDTFGFSYRSCRTVTPSGITEADKPSLILRALPNPTHGQTQLLFSTDHNGDYTIHLTDICGRELISDQATATAGPNSYTLHMAGMAKGIYMATIAKGNQNYTVKIVME